MAFEYKMNEDGNGIAVNDRGLPIIVDTENDNKEIALDAIHLFTKVPDLQNQLNQSKEKATKLQEKVEVVADIEDLPEFVTKAREALETIQNIDQQKLIDAGKVEEIKRQAEENLQNKMENMQKTMQQEIDVRDKSLSRLNDDLYNLMVTNQFSNSQFVKEGMAISPNVARKYFGERFKVEENDKGQKQVVGYYPNGDQIYSAERPGELANFDEALQLLVEKDPEKDMFLAGRGGSGSGAGGDGGGKGDKLADMKAQYEQARKDRNMPLAISLKNQLAAKGVYVN